MDGEEPDPGAVHFPTVFYGLWPRVGLQEGEADEAVESLGELGLIAAR